MGSSKSSVVNEEGAYSSETVTQQLEVEEDVLLLLEDADKRDHGYALKRKQHVEYSRKGLEGLPGGFVALDASRPWLCFWMLHSLDLLGALEKAPLSRCVHFLQKCQNPNGGFQGGPGQFPHLATSYAAVAALATIGTEEAYAAINRKGLHDFFLSMKCPSGGFTMQRGGEIDIRGCYCVMAAAKLAGVLSPQLTAGVGDYVARLQTYEGGIAGEEGSEAHGGYTFCGLAAAVIAGDTSKIDISKLYAWVCRRQQTVEGGFSGRANKLVDACYSYWQGAVFGILTSDEARRAMGGGLDIQVIRPDIMNIDALERYVLGACQVSTGGLRDKPGKPRDYYHTCYALSGLAVAQSIRAYVNECSDGEGVGVAYGGPENLLEENDNLFNVSSAKVRAILHNDWPAL